jgi:predicted regulator of Ras-like GTPase activity (Roadblock/LC7/MglB family)
MQWLDDTLKEVGEILQRQAVLVGAMTDDLEHARLNKTLEKILSALVHRISAGEGIELALACRGESLVASDGPLLDYVALSEATHAGRWAMEKVSKAFDLGTIQQTVVIGSEKKLAIITVGDVSLAIQAPLDISIELALA